MVELMDVEATLVDFFVDIDVSDVLVVDIVVDINVFSDVSVDKIAVFPVDTAEVSTKLLVVNSVLIGATVEGNISVVVTTLSVGKGDSVIFELVDSIILLVEKSLSFDVICGLVVNNEFRFVVIELASVDGIEFELVTCQSLVSNIFVDDSSVHRSSLN